ncbi:MAG TPA: hypothetical protein VIY51_20720 [Xanthobacteraceae bacterium]
MSDFYYESWATKMSALSAARASELALLEVARHEGDLAGAGDVIERIADLDARAVNLRNIQAQYERSQTPQMPVRREVDLTPDEACRMTGCDPDTYNRGVVRLQQLKAMGNYRD